MPCAACASAYGATTPEPLCTAPSPPKPRPPAFALLAPMPVTVVFVVMFAPPRLLALALRPNGPIVALDTLPALARVPEAAVPAPLPVEALPPAPVEAMDVVAAVPIGGLIRLSVPAVALDWPVPDWLPALLALPRPMPALLFEVVPVEPVVELDVPPANGVEMDVAEAPVTLVAADWALKLPRTVDEEVPPVTAEVEDALATWAFAAVPIREQATAAAAAIRDIFMVNTSR